MISKLKAKKMFIEKKNIKRSLSATAFTDVFSFEVVSGYFSKEKSNPKKFLHHKTNLLTNLSSRDLLGKYFLSLPLPTYLLLTPGNKGSFS